MFRHLLLNLMLRKNWSARKKRSRLKDKHFAYPASAFDVIYRQTKKLRKMGRNIYQQALAAFCLFATISMSGCQTSTNATSTATAENRSLAPERVDVRGSITMRRYDQGQVILEVEGFPSQNSRYNRAYVLVEPITQIIGTDGQSISLSELQQGQNVAIVLRGGGKGNNIVGLGVARKLWVEDNF